jgi:hypothetical protein
VLGRIESVRVTLLDRPPSQPQAQQQSRIAGDAAPALSAQAPAAAGWSMLITCIDVRSLPHGITLQFSMSPPLPLEFPANSSLLFPCCSGPNATIKFPAAAAASSSSLSSSASQSLQRPMFGLKSFTASQKTLSPVQEAAAPHFPLALSSPALVFAARLRKEARFSLLSTTPLNTFPLIPHPPPPFFPLPLHLTLSSITRSILLLPQDISCVRFSPQGTVHTPHLTPAPLYYFMCANRVLCRC